MRQSERVFHSMREVEREFFPRIAEARDRECPLCGAKPGEACTISGMRLVDVHDARLPPPHPKEAQRG